MIFFIIEVATTLNDQCYALQLGKGSLIKKEVLWQSQELPLPGAYITLKTLFLRNKFHFLELPQFLELPLFQETAEVSQEVSIPRKAIQFLELETLRSHARAACTAYAAPVARDQ